MESSGGHVFFRKHQRDDRVIKTHEHDSKITATAIDQ